MPFNARRAVDSITEPIQPAILLAHVKNYIELKHARDSLAHDNEWLEREVAQRTGECALVRNLTLNES